MHTFWSENLKGRDHLGNLGIDRNIILKWILQKGGKVSGINLDATLR
jgi:hypothetical protein